MKIGMVVDNEFVTDVRVRKEVDSLRRSGHQVYILCFDFGNNYIPKEYEDFVDSLSIKKKIKDTLYFLMNVTPFYEWFLQYHISKFISLRELDVIHAHDLYLAKASKRGIEKLSNKIPLVLDLHENYPSAVKSYNWTKGRLRAWLTRPNNWSKKEPDYLAMADRIIVLSETYKNKLLKKHTFLKGENISVLENTIDLIRFDGFARVKIDVELPDNLVLYFGAVAERRGIFEFLECLKLVNAKGIEVNGLIIGPIDKADMKRFNDFMRLEIIKNAVTYLQWIDISKLPSYMEKCVAGVAPFHKNDQHESGVANKLYQYMYGKKAIIASDCGPQKELIEKYICGLIFSDLGGFCACIEKVILDKSASTQMGINGYLGLIQDFSIAQMDQKLASVYQGM